MTRSTKKTVVASTVESSDTRTRLDAFAATMASHSLFDEELGLVLPTWKRSLLSAVANIAVVAVGCTSAFYLAMAIGTFALTMGTGAFIAICLYYFTMLLGMLGAVSLGSLVAKYVIQGKFNDDMGRATTWLRGKFARGEEVTVH